MRVADLQVLRWNMVTDTVVMVMVVMVRRSPPSKLLDPQPRSDDVVGRGGRGQGR